MKTIAHKDTSAEVKHSIFEIIDNMPEIEMRNFLTGLEKWKQSKLNCMRKHPRKDTYVSALIQANGRSFRGYITNISANGLFVEVKIVGSVRHGIFMEFIHPDLDNLIKVTCNIVRNNPNGIGVQFGKPLPI